MSDATSGIKTQRRSEQSTEDLLDSAFSGLASAKRTVDSAEDGWDLSRASGEMDDVLKDLAALKQRTREEDDE